MSKTDFIANIIANFCGSCLAGGIVLLGAFLINEKLYSLDLTGIWETTLNITVSNTVKDYELKFTIHILQNGSQILGYGEKISEKPPEGTVYQYETSKRVIIDVNGTIDKKYFSKSSVSIVIKEHGRIRDSSTVYFLKYDRKTHKLEGKFSSTASNSSGSVKMTKYDRPI